MRESTERVLRLFDELIDQGEEIRTVCKRLVFSGNKKPLAPETFEAWKLKCLSLLKSTFGASSPHFDSFNNLKFFDHYNSTRIYLGILRGAREDLEKGYFFHKDLMLSVNIYHSLISRAQYYHGSGEGARAAAVLEATLLEILAKICENKHLTCGPGESLREMLDHLSSAGVFGEDVCRSVEEQVEGLGRSAEGVEPFSRWLQDFMNEYLGSRIMILN